MKRINSLLLINILALISCISIYPSVGNAQIVTVDQKTAYYFGTNGQMSVEFDSSYFTCYLQADSFNLEGIEALLDSFPDFVINVNSIDLFLEFESTLPSFEEIIAQYELDTTDVVGLSPGMKVSGIPILLSNEIVVKKGPQISTQDLVSGVKRFDGEIIDSTDNDVYTVSVDNPGSTFQYIQQLHELGLLEWGQPDFLVDICPSDLDPLYGTQYQLNNTGQNLGGSQATPGIDVNIEGAWEITKGDFSVSLALFDDGVSPHPDLFPTVPFSAGNGSPENDDSYHGTSCAGIIGALHNDIGIKGVAPHIQLYSENIFTCGVKISSVSQAFYKAVDRDIAIINNSWGFLSTNSETGESNTICDTELFPALNEAISYAAEHGRDGKGTVIVFASGNSQTENSTRCVTYPANHPDVISVGSMTPTGEHASYSSIDNLLDFVVPSSDGQGSFGVVTLDAINSLGIEDGDYNHNFGGTSAAAPVLSGIVGLMLSVNPTLTREDVYNILKDTAVDFGAIGFDEYFGHGLPDAFSAVLQASLLPGAENDDCPDFQTISGNFLLDTLYQAAINLTSSQVIGASYDVSYTSGETIGLSSDFTVSLGAIFEARIESCHEE